MKSRYAITSVYILVTLCALVKSSLSVCSLSSLSCVYMPLFAGIVAFANVLAQPSHWGVSNSLTAILITLLITILSNLIAPRSSSDDKIPKLDEFHLVTLWKFFLKRYDFFREKFKKTGLKMFRFNVLQVRSPYWLSNSIPTTKA